MRIISKKVFSEAAKKYPTHRNALLATYAKLKQVNAVTPDNLRAVFPSLDNFRYKDRWWVIDISGNHLRLFAFIEFIGQRVYVKHIVTHTEYDQLVERYRRGELS